MFYPIAEQVCSTLSELTSLNHCKTRFQLAVVRVTTSKSPAKSGLFHF